MLLAADIYILAGLNFAGIVLSKCLLSLCAALKSFVLGQVHSCGTLEDGGVMCWGGNDNGQVGTGNFANTLRPTAVSITGGRFLFGLSKYFPILADIEVEMDFAIACQIQRGHMNMTMNAPGIAL